jgi:succinate dehydrogenase flavin-adding protein (antitoxin of CptAB toxin-antitoxin module)
MFVYPSNNKDEAVNVDRVSKIRKSKIGNYIDFLDGDEHEITSWKYTTEELVDGAYRRLLQKIKAVSINPNETL